jgi:hypothetical protein
MSRGPCVTYPSSTTACLPVTPGASTAHRRMFGKAVPVHRRGRAGETTAPTGASGDATEWSSSMEEEAADGFWGWRGSPAPAWIVSPVHHWK